MSDLALQLKNMSHAPKDLAQVTQIQAEEMRRPPLGGLLPRNQTPLTGRGRRRSGRGAYTIAITPDPSPIKRCPRSPGGRRPRGLPGLR